MSYVQYIYDTHTMFSCDLLSANSLAVTLDGRAGGRTERLTNVGLNSDYVVATM